MLREAAALLHVALCLAFVTGCHGDGPKAQSAEAVTTDEWIGVYASPSEIGGFSGTVLVIERGFGDEDELEYRKRSYSDVVSDDEIQQDVRCGTVMTDGQRLYVPEASGGYLEGKPLLVAHLTRYTRRKINGRVVLIRDDALRVLEREDKLYDYGILIRVAEKAGWQTDLDAVEHPSIKLLYRDPNRGWEDPYVRGPNSR